MRDIINAMISMPSSNPPTAANPSWKIHDFPRPTRTGLFFFLFIGLTVSIALLIHYHFGRVLAVAWRIGWGLGLLVAFHLAALVFCGSAWRMLFPPDSAVQTKRLILFRWVRESVNTLLPVGRIGGEVVGAHLLVTRGIKGDKAAATLVADRTAEVLALFFYAVGGVAAFTAKKGNHELTYWAFIGVAGIFLMLIVFFLVQRLGGVRIVEKWVLRALARWGKEVVKANGGVHESLRTIYQKKSRFTASAGFHLSGWLLSVVRVYLAMGLMGHRLNWNDAFVVESFSQIACVAAFIMPAALGVQEAGYTVICGFLGIPQEMGLALSLVKRACEILVGIPGLFIWQGLEGKRLWTGRFSRQC